MKYLLDTNVVSEMSKPTPDAAVMHWLAQTRIQDTAVSVITLGEVQRGMVADPSEKRRLALPAWYSRQFLALFQGQALDITAAVMSEWAQRYHLARVAGRTPSSMDSLIAATAAAHGLTVVTRNETDFTPMGVPTLNIWTP